MSAPETHDPRFVNTRDACWVRRAVTSDGRGLYAVEGSCRCPEFLLVSLAELAAVGIVGSADVLPAPSVSFAERAAAESDPARRVAWRMLAEPEPEFHAWLHHENRVSHDLPEAISLSAPTDGGEAAPVRCRCDEPDADPYECEADDCSGYFSELNPFGGGPVHGHDAKVSRKCGQCDYRTSVWHVDDGSAEEELHRHVARVHGGHVVGGAQ